MKRNKRLRERERNILEQRKKMWCRENATEMETPKSKRREGSRRRFFFLAFFLPFFVATPAV